jgi:hypothetical protein
MRFAICGRACDGDEADAFASSVGSPDGSKV